MKFATRWELFFLAWMLIASAIWHFWPHSDNAAVIYIFGGFWLGEVGGRFKGRADAARSKEGK